MSTGPVASFRDPDGRLFFHDNRVFRLLNPAGEACVRQLLSLRTAEPFLAAGSIVPTWLLDPAEMSRLLTQPEVASLAHDMGCVALAEHEAAPFASYAHEWPPEMLHAAGELTIRLALAVLADGVGLKDATPSNVMFWGTKAVFLDALSFERRDPHDPTWLPHGQFVRTFLLPLLVNRRYGVPLSQVFTTRRDGMEPEEVYALIGPLGRLRPGCLSLVSLPVWLGRHNAENQAIYAPRRIKNVEQTRFILESLLRRQARALDRLRPREDRQSAWSGYGEGKNSYSVTEAQAKIEAVRRFLEEIRPGAVLDLGCNTGIFSLIAADIGARVVAVDSDPVVVGKLWRTAALKGAPILPLVVNLARPTPALGWRNGECRSFLDRAAGAFDAVLMLALVHHLIVTERLPLAEIFATVRRLTRRWLIVEYVAPTDPMFVRLTRGRAHLHQDLNRNSFEAAAQRHFRIVRSEPVAGSDRRLYLMEAPA